jgi:hypothetical protein
MNSSVEKRIQEEEQKNLGQEEKHPKGHGGMSHKEGDRRY